MRCTSMSSLIVATKSGQRGWRRTTSVTVRYFHWHIEIHEAAGNILQCSCLSASIAVGARRVVDFESRAGWVGGGGGGASRYRSVWLRLHSRSACVLRALAATECLNEFTLQSRVRGGDGMSFMLNIFHVIGPPPATAGSSGDRVPSRGSPSAA